MATNDVYATYSCLRCGSEVKETPGIDGWGDHVYSYFECKSCGQKSESANMDEYVHTTYHECNQVQEIKETQKGNDSNKININNSRIIIFCEGGLVQSVFSSIEGIEVEILYHDSKACGDEEEMAQYEKQNKRVQNEIQKMHEIY